MTAIDRTAAYYAAMAERIAADPLAHYTRAEVGRRWQLAFIASNARPALAVSAPPLAHGEGRVGFSNVLSIKRRKA